MFNCALKYVLRGRYFQFKIDVMWNPKSILSNSTFKSHLQENISPHYVFEKCHILGLYFSGKWCSPCQKFDYELKSLKSKLKTCSDINIEFLLISSDKSQSECEKHAEELDMLYLSYDLYKVKKKLCRLYNVANLPQLTLIDCNSGVVINRNICNAVESNLPLDQFPWKQESFHDVLFADCGISYIGDKSKVTLSDLQHDRICVLFSANWCPPCRKVVPLLASTVNKSNHLTSLDKLHVSVIYINFDQRSTGSFAANLSDDGPPIHEDEYVKNEKEAEFKIPDNWLVLSSGGGGGSRAEQLAHIVGVSRIPHMCIIEPGQLTNTSQVWSNVVPMLMADPDWLLCGSLSIQYLTAATLEMMVSIDRALVAIAWLKEDVSIAFDILQEVSKCVPNFKVHYYVGWDGDAATRYLRSLLDIGDQSPMLMYLDFENECFSICPDKQVDHHLFGSQQDILEFITALESGSAIEISFPDKAKLN